MQQYKTGVNDVKSLPLKRKLPSCKNWQFNGSMLREPRSRSVFIQSGHGYLPLERNRVNIHSNNVSFKEALRGRDSPIELIVVYASGLGEDSTHQAPLPHLGSHNIN
jgi:hypothetical protein